MSRIDIPLRTSPSRLTVVCGPQGVGKSTVAAQLAAKRAASLHHFDDYVVRLRTSTTTDSHPHLHYRSTFPGLQHGNPEFVDLRFRIAQEIESAATGLVKTLARQGQQVVLEGDYLMPPVARLTADSLVAWVVLIEPDLSVVVRNFSAREPHLPAQYARAQTSVAVGSRLAVLARDAGVPVVLASPHSTTLVRLEAMLAVTDSGLENPASDADLLN